MTYRNTGHYPAPCRDTPSHSWDDFTYQRLAWLYGHERARLIIRGQDPATQADIGAWNRLRSLRRDGYAG